MSVVTGLLFGLAPALQTSRDQPSGNAQGRQPQRRGGFRRRNVRRGLVVAEMALSLTLLIGAGLLIKSVAKLQGVDPGFDPRNVLTFNLALPRGEVSDRYGADPVHEPVAAALELVPGVQAAGVTSVLPFGGGWSTSSFTIEGLVVPPGQNGPWGDIRIVSPKFFDALRVPLKNGRVFTDQDIQTRRRSR